MSLTNTINDWRTHRRYRRLAGEVYAAQVDLYDIGDHTRRACLLFRMAELQGELAGMHPAVYGPDPLPGDEGRDHAEWLAGTATLYRLLALTEVSLTTADPGMSAAGLFAMTNCPTGTDQIALDSEQRLWRNLAASADHDHRGRLIEQLADYVAKRLGEDEAESLGGIAQTEYALAVPPSRHLRGRPSALERHPGITRALITALFAVPALALVWGWLA